MNAESKHNQHLSRLGHAATLLAAGAIILGLPICGQGTASVDITSAGFAPQVVRIEVGNNVVWSNLESVHTTTSLNGLWDSGVLSVGDTFTYRFDNVGLYRYYDTIHVWPSGIVHAVHSLAKIELSIEDMIYTSGSTMQVGLSIENPGAAADLGIFIWVETPGGGQVWVVQMPSVHIPAGFQLSDPTWLTVDLPLLVRGSYSWHAQLRKMPQNDVVSSARIPWEYGRATQSDWSEGPVAGPAARHWGSGFAQSTDMAWLTMAGQLTPAAVRVPTPLETVVAPDAGRPNSVATGDVDGDGLADIITTDPVYDIVNDLGAVYWWKLEKDGSWAQHTVNDDFYGAHYAVVVDVDSDGDLDVAGAAFYGDHPNLGRNGRFAWFENDTGDGTTWTQHLVGDLFWGADYIDAGDLDGDGDVDLVGASSLTDGFGTQESDLTWFENLDGDGEEWGQHDLDIDFPNAREAHIGDMDGDGDLDVIGAYSDSFTKSRFSWWENLNGDGSAWTKHWIDGDYWGAGYCAVGDVDGDGDLDLLGSGYHTGQVGWWENTNGLGTVWQSWYVTVMPEGNGCDLLDFDGDGDLDALMWSSSDVLLVENSTGPGLTWMTHVLETSLDQPWVAADDVDGEGLLDVIIGHEEIYGPVGRQLVQYEIVESGGRGRLTSSILDGGATPNWGAMTWLADVPPGSKVLLDVRASNDQAALGPFVNVPASGTDLSQLVDPLARYLQYRVSLQSALLEATTVLHEVEVEMGDGVK